MNQLFGYAKKYWKLCIAVSLLAIINQGFSMLDPILFQRIIDNYATKFSEYSRPEFLTGVGILLLGIVGVAFVSRVAKNFQDYFLNNVTQKIGADMYTKGIAHALSLPYSAFEDTRSGETLNILQKARIDSEKFMQLFINLAFISLISLIFVIVYALFVHVPVAIVYALTIPTVGGLSYFLTKKLKAVQKNIVTESAALAGATTESLKNIEIVKVLGLNNEEVKRLNGTTEKILQLELKKLRYVRSISFVQGTFINLLRTVILGFLLYLVFDQTITFGQFFTLYIYSFYVFGPLQELGTMITSYRDAQGSLEKYQEILAKKPEDIAQNPQYLEALQNITFKNVSFAYGNNTESSLSNISLTLQKGETVAFVGPSGSGKTSLIKNLSHLYTPTTGTITYNNIPHNEIDVEAFRNKIGFVTQDTHLFSGTIKENMLFVKRSATDEEILQALLKAQCQTILSKSELGVNAVIGEAGLKLSGGEKQRLSIARALLRKPELLVFDEATSALDSLTEEEITKTIQALGESKEHITVLVAHRLSTIMHADKIYVLEKGSIIEQGTHAQLVAEKGLYYAMWRQQIGER